MPYSVELMEGLALRGQGDLSAADRATMAANYVLEQLGQDQLSPILKNRRRDTAVKCVLHAKDL